MGETTMDLMVTVFVHIKMMINNEVNTKKKQPKEGAGDICAPGSTWI